jgi:TRAP-type C4-dicarboxylate transport system substrate-binding protein
MKVESVVIVINNLMEKQQFGSARGIMLKEWNRITDPSAYRRLSSEAKELMKVISKEKETGDFNKLSEKDKRILNLLNEAVRDVKLPYAKKIFNEHRDLITESYAQKWLTKDARFMCFAWERNA